MLKITATDNPSQFMIITESGYRCCKDLEQILTDLYDSKYMDVEELERMLRDLERRIEQIEDFCNALSDAVGHLQ